MKVKQQTKNNLYHQPYADFITVEESLRIAGQNSCVISCNKVIHEVGEKDLITRFSPLCSQCSLREGIRNRSSVVNFGTIQSRITHCTIWLNHWSFYRIRRITVIHEGHRTCLPVFRLAQHKVFLFRSLWTCKRWNTRLSDQKPIPGRFYFISSRNK